MIWLFSFFVFLLSCFFVSLFFSFLMFFLQCARVITVGTSTEVKTEENNANEKWLSSPLFSAGFEEDAEVFAAVVCC